uniref:Reverse transcriptase domain-containing protein n=1 Tax=Nothobranchius kuhntae TaxID=321403 RepID=A0A1A8K0K3_NOTKU
MVPLISQQLGHLSSSVKTDLRNLKYMDFTQRVMQPTHSRGHTLDLVITYGLSTGVSSVVDLAISDHFCVFFSINSIIQQETSVRTVMKRHLTPEVAAGFLEAFNNIPPTNVSAPCDAIINDFNRRLESALNLLAPLKTKNLPSNHTSPWRNENLRKLKRNCRVAERRWRKSKLTINHQTYSELLKPYNKATGVFPAAFKRAVVRPLLKKSNLDFNDFNNFRPVSNLPFLSKILEKLVLIQLNDFINHQHVLEKFQSGFRVNHSTETALLKILNDFRTNYDARRATVLVLLDLSAAFDTVDHTILLTRLKQIGLSGVVHSWFTSYLTDRTFMLNQGKTEVLVIGPEAQREKLLPKLQSMSFYPSLQVKNLGVIFDSELTFIPHIKNITKIGFYHLKNIARVRPILSRANTETLVHAFVTSRIDYCNALLSGLPKKSISGLQLLQNSAARVLMKTRRREHITPVSESQHWLNGLGPSYLSELLLQYEPSRTLRSSGRRLLVIPKVRTQTHGEASFQCYGPRLWNELPGDLRAAENVHVFRNRLKTHVFSLAFN